MTRSRAGLNYDKGRVRVAYKEAEKSAEGAAPVTLHSAIQFLNDSAPDAAVSPLLDVARKRAIRLGAATEDADGNLVAQPTTVQERRAAAPRDRQRYRLRADQRIATRPSSRARSTARRSRPSARCTAMRAAAREPREEIRGPRRRRIPAEHEARHGRPQGRDRRRIRALDPERQPRGCGRRTSRAHARQGRAGRDPRAGPAGLARPSRRDDELDQGASLLKHCDRPARQRHPVGAEARSRHQAPRCRRPPADHLRQTGRAAPARPQRPGKGHLHHAAGRREPRRIPQRAAGRHGRSRRHQRLHRPAGAGPVDPAPALEARQESPAPETHRDRPNTWPRESKTKPPARPAGATLH
jgi:hypothetical protein